MESDIVFIVSFKSEENEPKEILNMAGLWDQKSIEKIRTGMTSMSIGTVNYIISSREIKKVNESSRLVTFFLKEVSV